MLSSIEFYISLRPLFRIEHFFYFHPFAYTYVRRGGTHIPPTSSSPSPSLCQVDIRVDSEKCSSSSSFLFFRPDVLPRKRTEYVREKESTNTSTLVLASPCPGADCRERERERRRGAAISRIRMPTSLHIWRRDTESRPRAKKKVEECDDAKRRSFLYEFPNIDTHRFPGVARLQAWRASHVLSALE